MSREHRKEERERESKTSTRPLHCVVAGIDTRLAVSLTLRGGARIGLQNIGAVWSARPFTQMAWNSTKLPWVALATANPSNIRAAKAAHRWCPPPSMDLHHFAPFGHSRKTLVQPLERPFKAPLNSVLPPLPSWLNASASGDVKFLVLARGGKMKRSRIEHLFTVPIRKTCFLAADPVSWTRNFSGIEFLGLGEQSTAR